MAYHFWFPLPSRRMLGVRLHHSGHCAHRFIWFVVLASILLLVIFLPAIENVYVIGLANECSSIFFFLFNFFFCFFTIFRCSEHFHMFNEFVSARVYMLSSLDLCRYDAFCCLSKWGIFGMTWLLVAFFFFLFLYTCASSSASLVESAAAAASNPPARNKWDRENASSILSVVVMYIWILEFGYPSTLHGGDGREYVWACLYCLENNRWHWHSVLVTMRCQNKF